MAKQIHVVKDGEQWKVKQDNAIRSSGNYDTQQEAIERAKEIARNQKEELTIHRTDGTIRDKRSFGNDPYPPKG